MTSNSSKQQIAYIRVFISSPGDVIQERGIATEIIQSLNYMPGVKGRYYLEALRWDDPQVTIPLSANETPQKSVNRYLIKPSDCDLVIVLFWTRIGSPLMLDGRDFLSGTHYELVNALEAADNSEGVPEVWVYRRNDPPKILMTDPNRDEKITQWNAVKTFFEEYAAGNRRGYNGYTGPGDFRTKLMGQLSAFLKMLDANPERIQRWTDEQPLLWRGSPFPGLRAFTGDDTSIYFGRSTEITQFLEIIEHKSQFVAVIAASGSGKSSFIRAGVIPRLNDGAIADSDTWQIVTMHPGHSPFLNLARAIQNVTTNSIDDTEIELRLRDSHQTLRSVFDTCLDDDKQSRLCLFIDQFEELFTSTPDEERHEFINLITELDVNLSVIITLRADFYQNALAFPELADLLREGTFPLAAPDDFALLEMIERPAERAGLQFEDGLARRIVQDTGKSPGSLALMAYLLDELYRKLDGENMLLHSHYDDLGGVKGAIGRRADSVFSKLPGEVQNTLPRVFRELLTISADEIPTRKRALLEKLTAQSNSARLLDAFINARLLVTTGEGNTSFVEVSHEALFHNWDVLQNWIRDAKHDLYLLKSVEQAAREWEANSRAKEYLWHGERLKSVREALQNLQLTPLDLEPVVTLFIEPEVNRLLDEINREHPDHVRRSDIGKRLAVLGDPRSGTGVNAAGIPDIEWCYVPGGNVSITGKTFDVQAYLIAKYPVTNNQFQAFVDAEDGYYQGQWWQNMPEAFQHPVPARIADHAGNHPCSPVTWYQSVAFTRWLHAKYDGQIIQLDCVELSIKIGEEWLLRLPTEWEWQCAAQGSHPQNEYPSGSWHNLTAVTKESGLNQTVAVGLYPEGIAECGAYDLAGNVWEWCLNEYMSLSTNEDGDKMRAQRGGSFHHSAQMARNTYRSYLHALPGLMERFNGFRLCIALAASD